jgi:hypothetical protein
MTDLQFPKSAEDVINRIDEAIVGIELLDNAGRDEVMRRLGGWILVQKYGSADGEILIAFDKYCISECLREDQNWQVPDR